MCGAIVHSAHFMQPIEISETPDERRARLASYNKLLQEVNVSIETIQRAIVALSINEPSPEEIRSMAEINDGLVKIGRKYKEYIEKYINHEQP